MLFGEATNGKLNNAKQFAEKFENKAGLGGADTSCDRISVPPTRAM